MNRIRWAVSALAVTVSLAPFGEAIAAPAARTRASAASSKKVVATSSAKKAPLPRYVSLDTIQTLRALRGEMPPRLLDPIPPSMPEILDSKQPIVAANVALEARRRAASGVNRKPAVKTTRLAQVGIRPARVPRRAAPVVPKWVRYPLEFQLGGIGLGTKALDKDRFNRIDRYGLFAMHGNPTAVVVPVIMGGGGGAGGGGGGAGAGGGGRGGGAGRGGAAGAGDGEEAEVEAPSVSSLTVNQTPPFGANLFPGSQNGELPDWASAVTVQLDGNHVQWLYNRGSYSMGFVVDRLGYVDAIVMAGIESPIGRTQLEDPVHTVKLGDDLRKVLFRYGYPDSVETYLVNMQASAGVVVPKEGGDAGGEGGGEESAQVGSGTFRTFELRYEQSYNVVFTIRNNRVVRIYIFGDPDFFNDARRRQLRVVY